MLFKNIIGSQETKVYLRRIVNESMVPHAQLFLGQDSSTALALALAFVTYLHCQQKTAKDACGQCPPCIKMAKLVHPDVAWLFPLGSKNKQTQKEKKEENILNKWTEFVVGKSYSTIQDWASALGCESKQLQIGRDQIKKIRTLLNRKAFESNYKTLLIWLPEHCNPVAANAMLKMVEEPNSLTYFVFITANPHQILPTLRSRMCQLHIPVLTDKEMSEALQNHYPRFQLKKIQAIAQIAQGNFNKAQKIASDQVENYFESFAKWLRGTYLHRWRNIADSAEIFHSYTTTIQKSWMTYAVQMVRATLRVHIGQKITQLLSPEAATFCERLAQTITFEQLEKIAQQLIKFQKVIQRNGYVRLSFLSISLRIATILRQRRLPNF